MNEPDALLETLQADVFAVLRNTPALIDATILADNEGDIESRVETSLATANEVNGKSGLSIVVLRPDVVSAESNLPGPPLKLSVVVQILENVTYNRDPDTGTNVRTSQAALQALGALHLLNLGTLSLYAPEKNPIKEVPGMKTGHVSHSVTLYCHSAGLAPAKTAGVSAAWQAGAMLVTGTLSPGAGGLLLPAGTEAGRPKYTSTGLPYQEALEDSWPFIFVHWDPDELKWYLTRLTDNSGLDASIAVWASASDVATPDLATGWTPQSPATGTPVITPVDALTLATTTSGAAIHYSTDGSYPAPDTGTLYAAPLTGLTAGTILRAVAYAAALNPSDLTELQITG